MNVFEMRGFADSELGGPRRHLALTRELRDALHKRERTAGDTSVLLSHELDRARLANALGEREELRQALSAAASMAAAMTVRERISGGEVQFTGTGLAFPDGETGASPPLWLDGLACAVTVRDPAARQHLANGPALEAVIRAAAASGRPIGNEPFWREYGRAFQALAQGQPIAAAHAQRARQQMATGSIGVLIREALAVTDEPVLRLIEIVAAGAVDEWPEAVRTALERFHYYFAGKGRAHSLPGYLPLPLLGLCALAADRGFPVPQGSPYLPEEFVRGGGAPAETKLAVRHPPQSILSADEAHWFFDLQGYPRTGRSHRLEERAGVLVARYEVPAGEGLPPASAEFVLVEEAAAAREPRLALDAGQLVFLAQAFASQVPSTAGDTARGRILLSDTVTAIDAALARIPPGADRVPAETIQSDVGRELLTAEPGRFRRVRLEAYRASIQVQLKAIGGPGNPAPADDPEAELRERAFAAAEIVRAEAMPVLEAFARDADGEFVRRLHPRDEDYAKVFVGEAAARARNVYQALWEGGLRWPRPSPAQTEIRSVAAPAGMFTWRNELSERFPGGYQGIADALDPHRVWLAWEYVEPGKPSGVSFDGLVWVDDHWVWFPKPYRYLGRPA
jgi:hypothetical protein